MVMIILDYKHHWQQCAEWAEGDMVTEEDLDSWQWLWKEKEKDIQENNRTY